MDITVSNVKKHCRLLLALAVFLALFIWCVVWLSGPLTVDDVRVPDVEDLMPGWEK